MISILIMAQLAQPLPRVSSCPMGYFISGAYCVPSRNATNAIEKQGSSCPMGYYTSGSYCVKPR